MRRNSTRPNEVFVTASFIKAVLLLTAFLLSATFGYAQFTDVPAPYCKPTHNNMTQGTCSNSEGMKIAGVELNTLSNSTTSCYTNTAVYRYWNNGNITTSLDPGGTYEVKVYTGYHLTSPTNYLMSVGAWIDFDQDQQFSSSEWIRGTATPTYPPGGNIFAEHKWTFTVPCSAKPGLTRIRFTAQYYNEITSSMYCGSINYGETQDYDVTITNSTSPSADFYPPDTIYTGAPAKFVNANQTGYIKHVWEAIGQGYADSSDVNFSYTFPNAGNYQIRLTSTNCGGTAIKTKNVVVVDPTRSPEANFVASQNSVIYTPSAIIDIDIFDLSSYGATNWEWIITPDYLSGAQWIPGGSPYDQNFNAIFYGIGEYDVCLIASNSLGVDTMCKYGYIKIQSPGAGSNFINKMGAQTGSDLDSGLIYDSGGANGDYQSNENWNFLIASCGAEKVELTFNSFNTAGTNDKLSVYEGSSPAGKLLGTFSGTSIPPMLTAKGDKMYLVFESDGSGDAPGFAAAWKGIQANNGAPAADFAIPDTLYTCSGTATLHIDNMSTGIIPGQPEYDWLMEYNSSVTYPPGLCDVCDEVNPSYTYTSDGTYNIRMVLQSCEGNDTIVKSLVVANTLSNPTVDFSTSETIVKVGGTVILEEETVAGCSYEWSLFPTTYTIENGGTNTDRQIEVKFTGPGSYHVTLKVTNDNGTTTRTKTNYIEVIQHCNPTIDISTVADLGITRVKVGDIDNLTGSGVAPGYTDYTDLSTVMMPGATYNIDLERPGMTNNVSWKVWVDWNRDGDFADFNEEVVAVANSSSDKLATSFTVPAGSDLLYGETRMRVGTSMGNASNTPCGPNQTGEYEDYTIFVSPDNILPVLQLIAGDTIIEVNTLFVDPGATAFDNIEGNISHRISVVNTIDSSQAGIYFIFYSVSDLSGNVNGPISRKVTVVADLTAPTISLIGNDPLLWSAGVDYIEPGYNTVDMPSGATINNLVTVSGNVDVNTIGDYLLTYDVVDNYGNSASVTRTVQVRDTTAPTVAADASYELQINTDFVDPVMASDDFDQHPTITKLSGNVNMKVIGDYPVTYQAEDASGNVSQVMMVTYKVADYIAPVIEFLPGTGEITVDVFNYDWELEPMYKVSVSDNFYKNVPLKVIYGAGYDLSVIGTYTITYEAEDKGGNVASWTRTVHVADREKPQVVATPLNIVRWAPLDDVMKGVAVSDNYYAPLDFINEDNGCEIKITRNNVDVNQSGIFQICYVAIDGSGNRSEEFCRQVNVVTPLGMEETTLENAITVYPNPNKGEFILQINAELAEDAGIQILDAVGNLVMNVNTETLNNGSTTIDLGHVAAGVYLLRIANDEAVASKRIVVTK